MFSVLSSGKFTDVLSGARVLDLFAGTGILSFEAVSRGAASACLVELNKDHVNLLQENIQRLDLQGVVTVLQANAVKLPIPAHAPYTLVFIDAPFRENLTKPALIGLINCGAIDKRSLVVVRSHFSELYDLGSFDVLFERRYHTGVLRVLSIAET